jgi:methylthioribulose-1-phosphate dehydratase
VKTTQAKPDSAPALSDRAQWPQVRALCAVGAFFHKEGWSRATSSNYSVVLSRDPLRLLITASGKDKGALTPADFVIVDERGQPIDPQDNKPSAETLLHVAAAERPGVGAVLHTHSTHESKVIVPIFDNTQEIPKLAEQVRRSPAIQHAYLIRRHGLYTWGATLEEAKRHVETLEFLFEVRGRTLNLAR